jgi:hypothetical protein
MFFCEKIRMTAMGDGNGGRQWGTAMGDGSGEDDGRREGVKIAVKNSHLELRLV